jgi:hypothetical protein
MLVEEVHESAFVVRLQDHQLDLQLARKRLELLVDLLERGGAVDVGLAPAEEVQVGARAGRGFSSC